MAPLFKPRTIVRNPLNGKAVRVMRIDKKDGNYIVQVNRRGRTTTLPVALVDEGALSFDDVVTHEITQRINKEYFTWKGTERA